MKTNKLGGFHRILKIKICRKFKTKIIMVRKTVRLWSHSSVATLEAHKSENGVKTIFFKMKGLQERCFWSDFWPRARPPPPHVLAYLRSRCSKLEPFFNWSPLFASSFLKDEKRYQQTVLTTGNYIHGKTQFWNTSKIGPK